MFEGFTETDVEADGIAIRVVHGGAGPPLLLLHGYPQMRAMWHKVAPLLAEEFTLVIPDLRGYGDSAKPQSDPAHLTYSKRMSAGDQVAVMQALGFERFAVAGHDRGARVGHRMALDFPERVSRLAVLDIVPTHKIFSTVDRHAARHYFLWFFLSQPADFPESIIGADPERYLKTCLGTFSANSGMFSEAAMAEYVRCLSDPASIHASCEDYRAAASVDFEHDEADLDRKVACPVFALWSAKRGAGQAPHDVMAAWRERAADVRGEALECGHFMPEEAPAETAAALAAFFG